MKVLVGFFSVIKIAVTPFPLFAVNIMVAGNDDEAITIETGSIEQVIEKFRGDIILFYIPCTGNITGCKDEIRNMTFFSEPLDR